MNNYFSNVGKNESKNIKSSKHHTEYLKNPQKNNMYLNPITTNDLKKIINKLKINKAGGADTRNSFISRTTKNRKSNSNIQKER